MYELVTQFSVDQQIQIVNTIGTWLAAFATTVAVVVSLRIATRAERVANKPRVHFSANFNPADPMFKFVGWEIRNSGSGPAYVLPMEFLLNGVHIGTNHVARANELAKLLPNNVTFMTVHGATLLAPGQRRLLLWIDPQHYNAADFQSAAEFLASVTVVIPHATIYGKVDVSVVANAFDGDTAGLRKRFRIPRKVKLED
ncbi:MAG TPA: hypothetical protein VIN58_01020 [Roseateles sp.]